MEVPFSRKGLFFAFYLLLLLLRHSRIRRHHLFRSLISWHLLRGLPTSLFPLAAYCKTCRVSLFASIQPICSIHLSLHFSILAFTENKPKSFLISSFLILSFRVHPFTSVSYTHLDVYKRQMLMFIPR